MGGLGLGLLYDIRAFLLAQPLIHLRLVCIAGLNFMIKVCMQLDAY